MKELQKYIIILLFTVINSTTLSQHAITVALDQFERFNEVQGGWCASDATISLLLPDGKTLWLFGDTFIGEKNGTYSMNQIGSHFINNSAIIDDGENLVSWYRGTLQNPSSLIPSINGDIFWPEHATIENDTLKIFAIQIIFVDNGTPGFNFRIGITHLAKYTYPGLEFISNNPVEYITDTTMRFGVQVLKRDDYTYIFGVKDTTAGNFTYPIPMLARVDSSVDEPWEFYAGNDNWTLNCDSAVSIGDRPMPESYFVYEKNNKFYLIMHEIWMVGELYILEADKITGPFNRATSGGIEKLFAVVPSNGKNITYNLFAHPQFVNEDKLLISFNVNASDFSSIYTDTRNYRARFLWLDIDQAISTVTPDTVYIFDDFMSIHDMNRSNYLNNKFTELHVNQLYIKNINSSSILNVYTIDGRKLNELNIEQEQIVDLKKYNQQILFIQLITNQGTESKIIILQ